MYLMKWRYKKSPLHENKHRREDLCTIYLTRMAKILLYTKRLPLYLP